MNSPRVLKGGFFHFADEASREHSIIFQYNPETIERIITPVDRSTHPKETIKFTLALDASDKMEHADPTAASVGIYPALSVLEQLVQPLGQKPITLLFWGAQRVLPIRVLQLTIREQMFDLALNPIRASVDVILETLTDDELKGNSRAKAIMDSYVDKKELLARQSGSTVSIADLHIDI